MSQLVEEKKTATEAKAAQEEDGPVFTDQTTPATGLITTEAKDNAVDLLYCRLDGTKVVFKPSDWTDITDAINNDLQTALAGKSAELCGSDPLYSLPNCAKALVLNEWQRRDSRESPWLGSMQLRSDRSDGPSKWSVASNDDGIFLTHEKNSYIKDVGVHDRRQAESDRALADRNLKALHEEAQIRKDNDRVPDPNYDAKCEAALEEIHKYGDRIVECDEMIASFEITKWRWNLDLSDGRAL